KHFRGYPLVSRWSLFRKKLPLPLKNEKVLCFLGGCEPYTRSKGCPICLSLNNASQLPLLCCCYVCLLLDCV
ncbi:unnamed protein product, partial [Musa textilis]